MSHRSLKYDRPCITRISRCVISRPCSRLVRDGSSATNERERTNERTNVEGCATSRRAIGRRARRTAIVDGGADENDVEEDASVADEFTAHVARMLERCEWIPRQPRTIGVRSRVLSMRTGVVLCKVVHKL